MTAPVKSARRILSLLPLKPSKDTSPPTTSPTSSPQFSHVPTDPDPAVHDGTNRSSSLPARHRSPSQGLSPDVHLIANSGPAEEIYIDSPLLPPPSLVTVNQSLAGSSPDSSGSRPQSGVGSRPSSWGGLSPVYLRPSSSPGTPNEEKLSGRRSWLPAKSRTVSMGNKNNDLGAWIAGVEPRTPYDLGPLARSEQIVELWNEQGDTFVYLFPQNTHRAPSFKVDSTVFADSSSLTFLVRGSDMKAEALQQSTQHLTIPDLGPNTSGPQCAEEEEDDDDDDGSTGSRGMVLIDDYAVDVQPLHLYLPVPLNSDVSSLQNRLSAEDIETLTLFRNLFAFLLGQALIATPQYPSVSSIFLEIAALLKRFQFSNLDGSNFGEVATSSFARYCDELHLADVRRSREKTIEAIVLGESLKSYPLYVEGFVHGVGKMEDIWQLRSPKYNLISLITQKRLERGYIDLENRLKIMRAKLEDFDFPSLFSGIANSSTSAESKTVRFKAWKLAFHSFRKFIIQYYRQKYGSWPPKGSSKKNGFEGSGLHRLLLKDLYNDFADLYDMLVDRASLTTRTTDMASGDLDAADHLESMTRALRRMMSEYDRSTPPVQPPIPFDLPQIPSLMSTRRKPMDPKKEAKERQKKLKDAEINEILVGSYTHDSMKPTPFIENFMQFERRAAHGKCIDEIADNRCGQWLFLYAVIQSLPLLVTDISDLQFTEGVEYFLCVAPRGGAPWIQNDPKTGRSWFGVAGGAGVVSLPSDIVTNGVEGIYRRSHCWEVATQWAERSQIFGASIMDDPAPSLSAVTSSPGLQPTLWSGSDLQPTSLLSPSDTSPQTISRTSSPAVGGVLHSRHTSINLGLEALPLPVGVVPVDRPVTPIARHNPNMSFDDILKEMPKRKKK